MRIHSLQRFSRSLGILEGFGNVRQPRPGQSCNVPGIAVSIWGVCLLVSWAGTGPPLSCKGGLVLPVESTHLRARPKVGALCGCFFFSMYQRYYLTYWFFSIEV